MRTLLRTGLLLFPLLAACGDSAGPDPHGPETFTATVNGSAWRSDTAVAILFGSICDTSLFLSAVRRSAADSTEEFFLSLDSFRGTTSAPLADTSTRAWAGFSLTHDTTGVPPTSLIYWSNPASPGLLRVTGVTVDDSLVSGDFAFQGATIPDTTAHRNVSGHFRVRYIFQQVFVVACD